jgi:hypothetical protein
MFEIGLKKFSNKTQEKTKSAESLGEIKGVRESQKILKARHLQIKK